MSDAPNLTDRNALGLRRARAKRHPALFLHDEAAAEIEERLSEVNKSYKAPLLVGHATPPLRLLFPNAPVIDDTDKLRIKPRVHDLVIHAFGLHWADDPVGQMVQSRLALQPDGLFLGVMLGGATLEELRASLAQAESKLTGGLSPRVLPMADIRDLGGLLQRAGLALPVADSRKLTVRYPDLATLVSDLRGMGETNALAARHKAMPRRNLFAEAEKVYRAHFSDDRYLIATFELVFLTGWAPDTSQPQPLRPGSAKTRLARALGVPETPLKRD
ncbi:MAG: SAM-dependent methyltransferase [Silicimonas sp.]|nr:SAM-dependent methyltransferase [Silicimonas sp.]